MQPAPHSMHEKRPPWKGTLLAVASIGLGSFIALHAPRHVASPPTQEAAMQPAGRVTLSMISPETDLHAMVHHIEGSQQYGMLDDIQKRRRLAAILPIADATGQTGRILDITSGGITQHIRLTPFIQNVLIPINQTGTIQLHWASAPPQGNLYAGIVDALEGRMILPPFSSSHPTMTLSVIVE